MSLTPSLIVAFGSFSVVPAVLLCLAIGLETLSWSRRRGLLVRHAPPPAVRRGPDLES